MGTPDYQGCWNAPCGFLECFETSKQGIQREIFEECGFYIDENDLKVIFVETDPNECNNGNVTIRHRAFLGKIVPAYTKGEGGEENEVELLVIKGHRHAMDYAMDYIDESLDFLYQTIKEKKNDQH